MPASVTLRHRPHLVPTDLLYIPPLLWRLRTCLSPCLLPSNSIALEFADLFWTLSADRLNRVLGGGGVNMGPVRGFRRRKRAAKDAAAAGQEGGDWWVDFSRRITDRCCLDTSRTVFDNYAWLDILQI
ncbi:hypothetical protein C4D60_Mb10t24980 [Musa balbisiana]|uniref:Uncharacterized protein n=1 Tax=Musa balbisiana TaxID=52838 RepID=A0A4S8J0I4_MUSBA|nr:hypothetical protein C4D60_Mb10t24980 [Musa balbisiana]